MNYAYLCGGAVGDSLLGMHVGRVVAQSIPGARVMLIATRHNTLVRDIAHTLPHVSYHEVIRNNPRTWAPLIRLAVTRSAIAVVEPSDVPLPLWWRVILRVSQLRAQGSEVHGQISGHERPTRRGVRLVSISREDNLFTTVVPRMVSAWGISPTPSAPSLPRPLCAVGTRPYIVFHFFAGSYRRSFPVEKARPLLERARARYPTHELVLTAARGERVRAEAMIQGVTDARIVVEPSASELLCVLVQASLTVGVASGITHLAAHLGAPLVALANLSDPYWLPSYGTTMVILADRVHCRCNGNKTGACTYDTSEGEVFRCLYYIPIDDIMIAMHKVLVH